MISTLANQGRCGRWVVYFDLGRLVEFPKASIKDAHVEILVILVNLGTRHWQQLEARLIDRVIESQSAICQPSVRDESGRTAQCGTRPATDALAADITRNVSRPSLRIALLPLPRHPLNASGGASPIAKDGVIGSG
jgi:hypothetical protein